MSEFNTSLLIVTLFRLAMVLVGFGFVFLGYKLFCQGVFNHAGELRAAWGDKNLALKQAAPGTFFALFGILAIGISVWKGTGLEYKSQSTTVPAQAIEIRDDQFSNYKIASEFFAHVGIPVEDASPVQHAFAYNVYYRCRQLQLSPTEIEDVFKNLILRAFKPSGDSKSISEGVMVDVRSELFKDVRTGPSTGENGRSTNTYIGKPGDTLGIH